MFGLALLFVYVFLLFPRKHTNAEEGYAKTVLLIAYATNKGCLKK